MKIIQVKSMQVITCSNHFPSNHSPGTVNYKVQSLLFSLSSKITLTAATTALMNMIQLFIPDI